MTGFVQGATSAIIMVCIYGSVGTPTEAGSMGVFMILCIAVYKGMRWKQQNLL